jgi:hypothetical protein
MSATRVHTTAAVRHLIDRSNFAYTALVLHLGRHSRRRQPFCDHARSPFHARCTLFYRTGTSFVSSTC